MRLAHRREREDAQMQQASRRAQGAEGQARTGRQHESNDESVRVRRAIQELRRSKRKLMLYVTSLREPMLQRVLEWIYQQKPQWTERASRELREVRDAAAEAMMKLKNTRGAKARTSLFVTGYVDTCVDKGAG